MPTPGVSGDRWAQRGTAGTGRTSVRGLLRILWVTTASGSPALPEPSAQDRPKKTRARAALRRQMNGDRGAIRTRARESFGKRGLPKDPYSRLPIRSPLPMTPLTRRPSDSPWPPRPRLPPASEISRRSPQRVAIARESGRRVHAARPGLRPLATVSCAGRRPGELSIISFREPLTPGSPWARIGEGRPRTRAHHASARASAAPFPRTSSRESSAHRDLPARSG